MGEPEAISVKLGSISVRYGVPGVLLTTGLALLALSVSRAEVFSTGIAFLFLGVLSFMVKEAGGLVIDLADDYGDKGYWQPEHSLAVLYILVLVAVAAISFLLLRPFMGI